MVPHTCRSECRILDATPLCAQDYLPLTRCAEDLLHLKSTWDTVAAVLYTFADWWVVKLA